MPTTALIRHSFTLALLVAASTSTWAQSAASTRTTFVGGLQFEVGLTAYQETYREVNASGQRIMQEKANMAGIQGTVTVPLDTQWNARVKGEWARGETKYTGSPWGGAYGDLLASGIDREKFEVQAEALFSPHNLPGTTFSAGLAARRLTDELQQMAGGYERTNTAYFATLGVEHRFALSSQWTLKPAVRYLHLIDGTQKVALEGGIRLKQNDGHGFDLSATLQQVRADGSGLRIRPFWRYYKIGASDPYYVPGGAYEEPKNTTRELGLDVSWVF